MTCAMPACVTSSIDQLVSYNIRKLFTVVIAFRQHGLANNYFGFVNNYFFQQLILIGQQLANFNFPHVVYFVSQRSLAAVDTDHGIRTIINVQ